MKAVAVTGVVLLAVLATGTDATAQPPPRRARVRQKAVVDKPWEAKADKNNDGIVGPREAAGARRDFYLRKRSEVDRPWEVEADTDKDGTVEAKELRVFHLKKLDANGDGKIDIAERKLYWKRRWAIVNTELEKKYDKDGDGFLDWPEAKEMLKDKLALIRTGGKAKVDTDIELEFDVNGDGVIDKEEAPALIAAIEEAQG